MRLFPRAATDSWMSTTEVTPFFGSWSPCKLLRLGFAGLPGVAGELFGQLEGIPGVFVRLLA